MGELTIDGNVFSFHDDASWAKWKDYMVGKYNLKEKIHWIRDHVLIDPPDDWDMLLTLVVKLEEHFKITQNQIKLTMKSGGQLIRGINLPEYTTEGMEFRLMTLMNISYEAMQALPADRFLLFLSMAAEKQRRETPIAKK